MIKIALVEDTDSIRLGQEKYLNAQDNIEVVIACASVEDFEEKFENHPAHIDLVVFDIGLPGKNGIEGLIWMKSKSPETQAIMVSVFTDHENIFQSLCAGAVGYLAKNTPLNELYEAILTVMDGGSPMTPSIARKVITHFNPAQKDPNSTLSPKEEQVVQCVVEGLSYKLIANRMNISINTVRHHIRNIYSKLQINSKAELIKKSLSGDLFAQENAPKKRSLFFF